jgi:hypothetical protein
MMVLEMQRQMEDDKMQKALAAERKKAAYLEKQKAKVQEYQAKKAQEEQEKRLKADKEKDMAASQRKKFLKEQESKKKQIADYKRKKMEAEEMLANADLPEYEDDFEQSYEPKSSYVETKKKKLKPHPVAPLDDEDRYLEEILSKNYI